MDVTTPFAKSLVMGIALASNVGGMTSPISSPQVGVGLLLHIATCETNAMLGTA
jgi:di/tricarboxylate transporter